MFTKIPVNKLANKQKIFNYPKKSSKYLPEDAKTPSNEISFSSIFEPHSHDYLLKFDGAAKNNPNGISSCGCVLYKIDNSVINEIWNCNRFLGIGSNNEAEYNGLLLGLKKIKEMNICNILVHGDSKLVINQMNRVYKVKAVNLIPLYESCKEISDKVKEIKYEHIYRHLNKRADELANMALESRDTFYVKN